EFKRRTLVHFAVDTEAVFMTTRLAGSATLFLPFNKGYDGGAGNPPDPVGRTYRTAYLWEEVLQRDSFLDLLARFVHLQIEEKRDDQGRKVKKETMIFTTLQTVALAERQLLKLAEARDASGTSTRPPRRCDIIIDEAHSSQGGETATELKAVLGGEGLRAEAQRRAVEEGLQNMEEL